MPAFAGMTRRRGAKILKLNLWRDALRRGYSEINHSFGLRFFVVFPIYPLALATRPDLSETAGTLFGGFKIASNRRDSKRKMRFFGFFKLSLKRSIRKIPFLFSPS